MNNYAVIITNPIKQGAVRTIRKLTLDVIAETSCDAAISAVRSVSPQGNFNVTVKALGARS